jgi:DNA-directed RNA polymerase specialized sigma24 family protein
MTDLECLNQYRSKARESKALEAAIDHLVELMGPQALAARTGARGTNEPKYAHLQHLDTFRTQFEENRASMEALRPQLERIMLRAPNRRNRAILMEYYGFGAKNDDIALAVGLSPRHVRRICEEFTRELVNEA